ncbi:unnamed protein product [Brassica oleracea]
MKRVFLNFVLLSFLLGVAFASQLRNTKTSTPEMKKVNLNFVLLSFFSWCCLPSCKWSGHESFREM